MLFRTQRGFIIKLPPLKDWQNSSSGALNPITDFMNPGVDPLVTHNDEASLCCPPGAHAFYRVTRSQYRLPSAFRAGPFVIGPKCVPLHRALSTGPGPLAGTFRTTIQRDNADPRGSEYPIWPGSGGAPDLVAINFAGSIGLPL